MFAAVILLSHFSAMILFAALVSAALGCLVRRGTPQRIRYAIQSFVLFLIVGVGIAWLMYPFSR
jgi:uncharacterized membrane protein